MKQQNKKINEKSKAKLSHSNFLGLFLVNEANTNYNKTEFLQRKREV